MKIEVVVNRCYGGFDLSKLAVSRLEEIGGLPGLKRLPGEDDENYTYRKCDQLERHDPRLVQVVRELGERANGMCSKLEIQTVNVEFEIESFDGMEKVEVHGWVDC